MTAIVPASTDDAIDTLLALTLATVAASTQRVYQETFDKWIDWCANHHLSPMSFHPTNIQLFIGDIDGTRKTRQRHLGALRALVRVYAVAAGTDDARRAYELLKMVKLPEGGAGTERDTSVLTAAQMRTVLDYWQGDSVIALRNRALIAALAYIGGRRESIATLTWRDLSFDKGTANFRHAKGDKNIHSGIMGDEGIAALEAWHAIAGHCVHAFPRLTSGGNIAEDTPMTGQNVYRIVKQTEKATGIALTPHKFRRTLGTELLAQDVPPHEVQQQLGHANVQTTLTFYAKAGSAAARRRKWKVTY